MISSLALAFAATMPAPKTITVESLLQEMTDLSRLAERPDPWYRYKQWTSYDRNSDNWKDPFANGDAGQFIRTEMHDGRTEHVMADVKGPGALVRLWSANPVGTIRFYFDGEEKPRLVSDMKALLTGADPMFPAAFSYIASLGTNLYYPMPFAQGLKITWDGPKASVYYAAGIREYVAGTNVETFEPSMVARAGGQAAKVEKDLFPRSSQKWVDERFIAAGKSMTTVYDMGTSDGRELRNFAVRFPRPDQKDMPWGDPNRIHNLLRKLRLQIEFDGETTVDVPLGDFFGSPFGSAVETLPVSVREGGTMIARWSMPYKKRAKITITNNNPEAVSLNYSIENVPRKFTPGTYLFHARWHSQTKKTRPFYDFNFLDAKGEGRFVGAGLVIGNPVTAWWGEGDEKVYVDGETFPSLFGTGTEDYFGYAWSNPTPFTKPYHAQPKTPNFGTQGQTQNSRYHIIDDITFGKSIRFDMEAWHWADVTATFATTAYWYALPGSTLPEAPDPSSLPIAEIEMPKPVKGAIEGELLKWKVTGGKVEMQGGFAELSGMSQFWWQSQPAGSIASTKIKVPSAGRYELFANLGHARDYGKFRISVNGVAPVEMDFYSPDLAWKRSSLGTFDLPAGDVSVQFETLAANPASVPGTNMLGVDYFLLEKK
jgi:hypothetical protein